MKRCSLFALLCFALVITIPQAHAAGIPINITVDEFGNGTSDAGGLHVLPAGLVGDPSGGLGSPVLVYALGFTPVAGDLRIDETEPVGVAPVISDIVRFFGSFMIFYSDNGDGVDALADTGLPGSLSTNLVSGLEVGPEGANGFVYTPTAGQPGYISTDFTPTYNITSDSSVPEPGVMGLMTLGLAGLGLLKFKRQAKR